MLMSEVFNAYLMPIQLSDRGAAPLLDHGMEGLEPPTLCSQSRCSIFGFIPAFVYVSVGHVLFEHH